MSAVPEPCPPNADANRIRRDIERLSQEQNKALEIAMYAVMSPTEQNQYDQRHKQIVDLLWQLAALDARDLAKLSTKMVELSLQEAQCDPPLRETIPNERRPISSPLLWPSTDVQRIARPSFEDDETMTSEVRKAVGAAVHLNRQQGGGTFRARMNQWFFTFGRRTMGPVTLAAERNAIRQRIGSLIEHLSRSTARAAEFVADRISATKVYRCRDCNREVGFRSRPRTLMECYILPLLLMQPVRCAACFRRDYRLILTTVHERSRGDDDHIPGSAA